LRLVNIERIRYGYSVKRPTDPDIKLLQAVADPTRLAILNQLSSDGAVCACDFTACCAVHQPTVSHHLRVLREAGWVTAERHGTSIYYAIRPEAIDRFRELAAGLSPGPARPLAELEVLVTIPAVGHVTPSTSASDPALALPPIDPAPATVRTDQTH
jgi:ArsR family transcriptional regulator, arsenate/arsenite/antimonite-responsive transcriptional repressor